MLNIPDDRSVFTLTIPVIREDIDELNHVNNVVYLRWVQDVAFAHWDTMAPEALKKKFSWVVLRHEIDYHSPAVAGDEVEAFTWIDSPNGTRQKRYAFIRRKRDGKPLASACTTWCLLDAESGRPKRVSNEISELFGLKD